MKADYLIQYWDCQSCTAKANCTTCEQKLTAELIGTGRFSTVKLDMKAKKMSVETVQMSEDDLLDFLEGYGIFAD